MPARFALLIAWADALEASDLPGAAYARFLADRPAMTDPQDWPDAEGEPHPPTCRCPDCYGEASPILEAL